MRDPAGAVIESLRQIRLTRFQLALIASISALASVAIIVSASGKSPAQSEVLALLSRRLVVRRVAAAPSAVAAPAAASGPLLGGGGVSGSGSGPSAASSAATGPSASSAPSAGSAASGASSGNSGAGSGGSVAGSGTSAAAGGSTTTSAASATKTHKVKHVFVIALSTTSYAAAFGPGSVAHYLDGTLRKKGALLSGYRSLSGSQLPDYLGMISGQAPNADTRSECLSYTDFAAGAKPAADGLVPGAGCVYPNTVTTIGDQVTASGATWKAYLDDMGASACVHPGSGALDNTALPFAGAQYDTRHNPFIYFHSLLDLGDCASDDVALDQLPAALRSASKTPRYLYVAPGLCADASATACPAGQCTATSATVCPGGVAAEDAFLKLWVPRILASPAYRKDGALVIAFAPSRAGSTVAAATPVRTGALILSRYAKAGRTVRGNYDPYSLLRSVEDLFGYKPLGRAARASSFLAGALPGA